MAFYIKIEAEECNIIFPFRKFLDPLASGRYYINSPKELSESIIGKAIYNFNAPKSTSCLVFARVKCDSFNENTCYIKLNNDPRITLMSSITTIWDWRKVGKTHQVNNGTNNLVIETREHGLDIDVILITDNLSYTPSDDLSKIPWTTLTPTPIPSTTGSISCTCNVSAKVTLNSSTQQTTPCIFTNVPTGQHTLYFSYPGYHDKTYTTTVHANTSSAIIGWLTKQDISTPTPIPTTKKRSPCPPYGDINNDGWITLDDINRVADHIVKKRLLTTDEQKRADVSGNGSVSAMDLQTLHHFWNDTITKFPVCDQTTPITPKPPSPTPYVPPTLTPPPETGKHSPCPPYGDINNDGYVTKTDVNMVAHHITGKYPLTGESLRRAKVAGQSTVGSKDLLAMISFVNDGTIFPVCGQTPSPIPSTPTPTPTPPIPSKCNLTISATPAYARIKLDNGTLYLTPKTFSNINCGTHRIEIYASGYTTQHLNLYLQTGSSQTQHVNLQKVSGPTPTLTTPTPRPPIGTFKSYNDWVTSKGGYTGLRRNLPAYLELGPAYIKLTDLGFTVTLANLLDGGSKYMGL